jgi:hypothetical protein
VFLNAYGYQSLLLYKPGKIMENGEITEEDTLLF